MEFINCSHGERLLSTTSLDKSDRQFQGSRTRLGRLIFGVGGGSAFWTPERQGVLHFWVFLVGRHDTVT